MSDRTVVISDLHLGREIPATLVAENLRPIWREADHLVINGDVAEVHHPRHRGRAARQMVRLAELCEADGTSLTLLSGNHDPYLSDVRHLMLAGRNVLVTHGDALHPAIAPWSPAAGRMESAYAKALATLAPTDAATLSARLAAAQHACHEEWNAMAEQAGRSSVVRMLLRPHAVAKVLHYWHIFPGLAEQFVRHHAPDATFVLLGHTHHAGIWPLHGRVIINTGAF
ncbi:MAG: metallophosphoesterase, partial [Planctomycetota bacterium]